MARCRHLVHGVAALLEDRGDQVGQLLGLGDVDLVEDHEARAVGEAAVLRELLLDDVEVAHGVAIGLERRAVEHVHQGGAALDVPQELQAQPLALAGAGDEAGDVGDGEADVARLHDAEVRGQGRERVVGDLRAGPPRWPRRGWTSRRSDSPPARCRRRSSARGGRRPPSRARRAGRTPAPCDAGSRGPRCRGHPDRRRPRRTWSRRRAGRRGTHPPRTSRSCRRARGGRGRRPSSRCGARPGRACPRSPCGAGRGGSRGASSRSGRRRGSRRRRCRRCRRPGRRAA